MFPFNAFPAANNLIFHNPIIRFVGIAFTTYKALTITYTLIEIATIGRDVDIYNPLAESTGVNATSLVQYLPNRRETFQGAGWTAAGEVFLDRVGGNIDAFGDNPVNKAFVRDMMKSVDQCFKFITQQEKGTTKLITGPGDCAASLSKATCKLGVVYGSVALESQLHLTWIRPVLDRSVSLVSIPAKATLCTLKTFFMLDFSCWSGVLKFSGTVRPGRTLHEGAGKFSNYFCEIPASFFKHADKTMQRNVDMSQYLIKMPDNAGFYTRSVTTLKNDYIWLKVYGESLGNITGSDFKKLFSRSVSSTFIKTTIADAVGSFMFDSLGIKAKLDHLRLGITHFFMNNIISEDIGRWLQQYFTTAIFTTVSRPIVEPADDSLAKWLNKKPEAQTKDTNKHEHKSVSKEESYPVTEKQAEVASQATQAVDKVIGTQDSASLEVQKQVKETALTYEALNPPQPDISAPIVHDKETSSASQQKDAQISHDTNQEAMSDHQDAPLPGEIQKQDE